MHERIAAELRAKIMDGTLGGQLPTTDELNETYGASNATITKVMNTLRQEGLIYSRRGRGAAVFVSEQAQPDVTTAEVYREVTELVSYGDHRVSTGRAPGDVARILGVEETLCRSRTTYVDHVAVELSESHMPVSMARELGLDNPRKIRGGIRAVLEGAGLPQRRFTDEVSGRQPTSDELKALELPAGVPVLRILRTIYTDGDRIVGVDVLVKGAHRFRERYGVAVS